MVIYRITNKVNGKIYIGQTVQAVKQRWSNHKSEARNHGDTPLYRAMRKYGQDNFLFEVVATTDNLDSLNSLEAEYIAREGSLVPNGYNLTTGGMNHRHHESTKQRLSDMNKGKPITNRWDKGNSQPPSEETRAKISGKLKGRKIKDRWTMGNRMPRTEAQKQHLSDLNKGRPNKALYKRVLCVETGVVYESVNAAALAFGVNRVTISSLVKSGKTGRAGVSFKLVGATE